jgi:branched-chain amino acid transport system substrate-binding protein
MRGTKRTLGVAGLTAAALVTVAACGGSGGSGSSGGSGGSDNSAGGSGGTVTIGESTSLSGSIAKLGQTGLNGVKLAVADINSNGGLRGKKVKVVSADDGVSPATGASNARKMITSDHAVALFGPVASSIGSSEEKVAAQYKIPIFMHTSNDSAFTTKDFTKYVYQFTPSTVMEPRAVADYLAKRSAGKKITIATFAPDYSYGHDTVSGFLKALKALHVNYKLVGQQFPPLQAKNIDPYLSKLVSAHPQYLFNAQYGGDLVTFTKQAEGFNLFKKTKVISLYALAPLEALGAKAPAGAIAYDRGPFWEMKGAGIKPFTKKYHDKYGEYPTEWAIQAYTSVQAWAYAVKHAKTFDADKVVAALSGATVPTIRGSLKVRACDHQAEIPEYVGVVAAKKDPTYDLRLWKKGSLFVAKFKDIALTCSQAKAMQP